MKITKSKPAFVLGLIGGILSTLGGSCVTLFATAVNDVVEQLGGTSTGGTYTALAWLLFLGGILAIVASSFCLKKAKLGGSLLLVSFAMTIGMSIYNLIESTKVTMTSLSITLLIFGAIPSILVLVGGILGLVAKSKTAVDVVK